MNERERIVALDKRRVWHPYAAMDEYRRRWMRAMVARDNRVFDSMAIGHLMSSGAFLATTAIFILGADLGAIIRGWRGGG